MTEIAIAGPGMNALSMELMSDLTKRLRAAKDAPLLLTGGGKAFCAGLNLKEVASLDEDGLAEFLGVFSELCTTLYHYPGPTVAHVNGHAIAGGCLLMLFCDHRVISDNPKIKVGLNEVMLGVTFPTNILRMVRSRIPRHHLDEVLLGGALHSPAEAHRLGLVDRVSATAREDAERALSGLAKHPRRGFTMMKAALRANAFTGDTDARLTRELAATWASDEVRARLMAALGR